MQVDYHFTERASRFLTNEADDCNCSPKDVVVRIIENAAERAELGLEKYEESLLRQLQLMRDGVTIDFVSFTYSSFRRKRCDGWFMCFLDDGKRYLYKFVRKEAGDFFLRLCELMDRLEKEDEIDDLEGVLAKLREGGGKK